MQDAREVLEVGPLYPGRTAPPHTVGALSVGPAPGRTRIVVSVPTLPCWWRAGWRTGDERYFRLIEHTLERICEGGIYGHVGGGVSRDSTDERWLVPQFEKMPYDNARLLELLALAPGHSRSKTGVDPPA